MRSSRELALNPRHYAHRMPTSENPGIAFFDENPMSTGAMVGIGLGVAAAIGIGYYFYTKQAAAAAPPAPAPTNLLTQPVTNATAIQTAQQQLALVAANGLATGLPATAYTPAMVNGVANDPQFVSALALFQQAINSHGGYTPPGGKGMLLNTTGVLDMATAQALAVIAAQPMKMGATSPTSDITTVFGPYTNITGASMQPGEQYLYSSPAQSGQTVDSAAANLSNSGFSVFQYWDVGVIPPSWPIDDASPYEWRFIIQNNGSSPVNPGAGNLYATNGMTAGLPDGMVGQVPSHLMPLRPYRGDWYSIAPASVNTVVPASVQSDFARWYNGRGARPQPLPAGMPPLPAVDPHLGQSFAWTENVLSQGRVLYFAAGLKNGVLQWWQYLLQPPQPIVPPHVRSIGGGFHAIAGVGQMPESGGVAPPGTMIQSVINPNGIVPAPSGLHWKLSNRAWPGTSPSAPVHVNVPPNMQGFYQLEGSLMRFALLPAAAVSAPSVTPPGNNLGQFPMLPALVWTVFEWAPGAYHALTPQALATLAAAMIKAPGVIRWAGIPQAVPASAMQQTKWSNSHIASVVDPGSGLTLYVTYSIGQSGPLAGRLSVVVGQRYAFLFNRVVLMPVGPCPPGQQMINGKCQMTFGTRGVIHHA